MVFCYDVSYSLLDGPGSTCFWSKDDTVRSEFHSYMQLVKDL